MEGFRHLLDTPQLLALAAALGWASGVRLYAAVFLVGIAGYFGLIDLPQGFTYRVLSSLGEAMSDGGTVPDQADGMGCFDIGGGTRDFLACGEFPDGDIRELETLYFPRGIVRAGDISNLPGRTPATTAMSALREGKKRFDMIMSKMRVVHSEMGLRLLQNVAQMYQEDPDLWNKFCYDALGDQDATGVAARIRSGEITPQEALDAAGIEIPFPHQVAVPYGDEKDAAALMEELQPGVNALPATLPDLADYHLTHAE